jgi:multisubunit Na+/H+ antiporter MnhB subunit
MKGLARFALLLLAALFATALIAAMLDLSAPAVDLPGAVAANLAQSGVDHPVTAVLLNFRGYDTLLEVAVLLLALLGILAVSDEGQQAPHAPPGEPVRQTLARFAIPLMILTAGYLLWAGAHRPGGAFQAGVVLAAAAVLLNLARLLPAWTSPGLLLRLGLVGGFLNFLTVAAALLLKGSLLQYPPPWAGALILLIETGLTLSIGLIMTGLFLLLTDRRKSP